MLPRNNRLTAKRDFEKIKKLGAVLTLPFFIVSYLERGESSIRGPRFGFVVSSHLEKRASQRNRLKRRLRETVRIWLKGHRGNVSNLDLDIVFVLRRKMMEASYEGVNNLVDTLLPKIFKL